MSQLSERVRASIPQNFIVDDFDFENGRRLNALTIRYVTLGEPIVNAEGLISNAVLLIHGTAGNWQIYSQPWWTDHMFAPGQPLDLNTTSVIISDNLGAGGSSKPSDGLRMQFPAYSHADVVEAHYRLVQHLNVQQLQAVIGSSYGGRLAWQWAIQHPEAMRAVIPLIASPFPSAGRRGMQDFLGIEPLLHDPSWQHGDYERQPDLFPLALMAYWVFIDGAEHLWKAAPTREAAWAYLPKLAAKIAANLDANDWIYQLRVNDRFNVAAALERIQANVLAIELSGDEMVPVELGQMERVSQVLQAKFSYAMVNEAHGYGHSALPFTMQHIAPRIGQFLASL